MNILQKRRFALILISRIVLTLLLFAAIVLVFYWYYHGEWREMFFRFKFFFSFRRLTLFVLSFGAYSKIVFVLLQALQVLFAPVPGEITGFLGGYLYGKVLGTVLSTGGLALGSVVAFEITRVFGTPLVKKVVRQDAMDRFDNFVTHRGLHIAYILFLIPGFPKDSLCYLLGLTHLRRLDFLLMNVFGRLPGTLILSLQGEAVRAGQYQAFFTLLIGSIGLTGLLYFLRNYIVRLFAGVARRILRKLHRRSLR